jgi:hypothetical protein
MPELSRRSSHVVTLTSHTPEQLSNALRGMTLTFEQYHLATLPKTMLLAALIAFFKPKPLLGCYYCFADDAHDSLKC